MFENSGFDDSLRRLLQMRLSLISQLAVEKASESDREINWLSRFHCIFSVKFFRQSYRNILVRIQIR